MAVYMTGKNVLVTPQRIEEQRAKESLIILPDAKELKAVPKGVVKSVGHGVTAVKVGDFVHYEPCGYVEVDDDIVIHERDIFAVEEL